LKSLPLWGRTNREEIERVGKGQGKSELTKLKTEEGAKETTLPVYLFENQHRP
jgi:hypothetical protein